MTKPFCLAFTLERTPHHVHKQAHEGVFVAASFVWLNFMKLLIYDHFWLIDMAVSCGSI